ncbi:dynamin family protein [Micromonospora lupini]|uniref:Isoniazid inducible gene protein IniA GTP-binding domain n=1 Tax=Micromonospora lupini str. Lupac 08 TaxID=1150864 RepID=I0L2H0_9ACTN|nr:dynamin family protein [Micromonospora lupini]CCH18017.1 Isoniazid inducible gene protein IniA; GTP-binding domain [Micromonospora lupini str. Lupac 08]
MAGIWLDVLDEIARTCTTHGRGDLLQTVRQKRAQLLDPKLRVLVVGEPNQGKSQLINAIINAPACPVGDGRTTVLPTVVQHAEAAAAAVVQAPPASGRPMGTAGTPAATLVERTPLALDQVAAGVSGAVGRQPGGGPAYVEVGLPRAMLAAGLVLVDTPGTDQVAALGGAAEVAASTRADAVLLVSDSTRELSVAELDMLLHVTRSQPNVVVVQSKTDLVADWRAVAERNRQHLADAGVAAPLIPVSATLRLRAAATDDRGLNAESGFPALIARLQRDLTGKADHLARASVQAVARTVVEQLAAPLRAELATQDAEEQSGPISRLHAAQREVDELRRCSTRWQNTLADEMADLLSDIEYDLRDRTRQILRAVDEAFDTADPLVAWDTFAEWLERSLVEAAEANHEWLIQRCDWVARRVAANFDRYGYDVLPPWSMTMPADLGDRLPDLERPRIDRFTTGQKLFTGMKGSYGGMLMFGLATTLAGMPMINPVSVGIGALFGGKSIRDEGKQLLRRRQATVKTAIQRHVDEFFVRMVRDCRDAARQVQRMLRDHFTGLTEELQEAIVQSFRSAKQEADTDVALREQRQREIRLKMTRLAALYEQSQQLTGARSTPVLLEPRA